MVERLMLVMEDIAQLVGNALGRADGDIHIVVGMSINPIVDATVLDIILQLHNENTADSASGKGRALHAK